MFDGSFLLLLRILFWFLAFTTFGLETINLVKFGLIRLGHQNWENPSPMGGRYNEKHIWYKKRVCRVPALLWGWAVTCKNCNKENEINIFSLHFITRRRISHVSFLDGSKKRPHKGWLVLNHPWNNARIWFLGKWRGYKIYPSKNVQENCQEKGKNCRSKVPSCSTEKVWKLVKDQVWKPRVTRLLTSNLKLEDHRFLFSLRWEMNLLKTNFNRNKSIALKICIKSCMQELDNEHLVFCKEINKQSELRFEHIQNRSLELKIEALKQAKSNDEQRKKKRLTLWFSF